MPIVVNLLVSVKAVKIRKKFRKQKNIRKTGKKYLTTYTLFGILAERLWADYALSARICDDAGDCRQRLVTSAEYVRHRLYCRCAIGRLRNCWAWRISSEPGETGRNCVFAGLFFGQK